MSNQNAKAQEAVSEMQKANDEWFCGFIKSAENPEVGFLFNPEKRDLVIEWGYIKVDGFPLYFRHVYFLDTGECHMMCHSCFQGLPRKAKE